VTKNASSLTILYSQSRTLEVRILLSAPLPSANFASGITQAAPLPWPSLQDARVPAKMKMKSLSQAVSLQYNAPGILGSAQWL
jgi:hypothetical protein